MLRLFSSRSKFFFFNRFGNLGNLLTKRIKIENDMPDKPNIVSRTFQKRYVNFVRNVTWFVGCLLLSLYITRAAIVHFNFQARSTFLVPVCTVPHGHWVNKADA